MVGTTLREGPGIFVVVTDGAIVDVLAGAGGEIDSSTTESMISLSSSHHAS